MWNDCPLCNKQLRNDSSFVVYCNNCYKYAVNIFNFIIQFEQIIIKDHQFIAFRKPGKTQIVKDTEIFTIESVLPISAMNEKTLNAYIAML